MINRQDESTASLELQIIKLTFYIVSVIAIINFSLIDSTPVQENVNNVGGTTLQLIIDIRSVMVLIITSWIDCLELGTKNTYYLGNTSILQERRHKRNAYGGMLGIILIPICFLLMFMETSGIDITIYTQIMMSTVLFFIGIKVIEIVEIFNLKYGKKVENKK